MSHLLDTNTASGLMRRAPGIVRSLRQKAEAELFLSVIVLKELRTGALRSDRANVLLRQIDELPFPVLAFEQPDAVCAAELDAQLHRAGTRISALDTLIAGQALARDLTLVTHNTREFARIPGLRLEDWEA